MAATARGIPAFKGRKRLGPARGQPVDPVTRTATRALAEDYPAFILVAVAAEEAQPGILFVREALPMASPGSRFVCCRSHYGTTQFLRD